MDERQMRRRVFAMVFAASLFAFSVVSAAVVYALRPRSASPPAVKAPADSFLPSRSEDLTVLIACSGSSGDAPSTYILAGYYPFDGSVPLLALSDRTVIEQGEVELTLGEVFDSRGIPGVKASLSKYMGIKIDRTAVLTQAAFEAACALLGPIEYDMPFEVAFEERGSTITLLPGLQRLDGGRVAGIIRHRDYGRGEPQRLKLTAALAAELFNQKLGVAAGSDSESIFTTVINLLDTDITYADYELRLSSAKFLHKLELAPAYGFAPQGADLRLSAAELVEYRDVFATSESAALR